jgi:RNA polymerase sigma factor (sigma-70 family)
VDLLQHDLTSPPARAVDLPLADQLAVLHQQHYLALVRAASVLVDSREAAEEVVQQAFLDVLRRGDPPGVDVAAYLRRAVVNGARDRLRRRRVRRLWVPPHQVSSPGPEDAVLLSEEHHRVLAALRQLPPRQREVLVLRHLSGLTEAETAAALGISISAAKSGHHKGIHTLRARMSEGGNS